MAMNTPEPPDADPLTSSVENAKTPGGSGPPDAGPPTLSIEISKRPEPADDTDFPAAMASPHSPGPHPHSPGPPEEDPPMFSAENADPKVDMTPCGNDRLPSFEEIGSAKSEQKSPNPGELQDVKDCEEQQQTEGRRSVRFSAVNQQITVDDLTLPGQIDLEKTKEVPMKKGSDEDLAGTAPSGVFGDINQLRDAGGGSNRSERSRLTVADLYYKKDNSPLVRLASSRRFEYTTLAVISMNGIWIGVDTDHNHDWTTWPQEVLLVADNAFCVYFTMEVLVRFAAFERKINCMKDAWFRFDTVLVTLMVAETWVMPLASGGGDSGGMGNLSILRLLRLLRLTRMAKLMQAVPELLTLVKGIVASFRSVGSVVVLLVAFIYVFAILFTGQYKESDDPDLKAYFGSMSLSMFTLFINGTILDDATTLFMALLSDSQIMLWVLIIFILLSSFTMLNMLIGILCEVVSATGEGEKAKAAVNQVNDVLTKFFDQIDADGSGKISKDEWLRMIDNAEVMAALSTLGIEENHLSSVANVMFTNDGDDNRRELDFDEFLEELLRIKPDSEANSLEACHLGESLRKQGRRLTEAVDQVLDDLEAKAAKISNVAAGSPLPANGEKVEFVANQQRAPEGASSQQHASVELTQQKPLRVKRTNLDYFSNEEIIEELRRRGRASDEATSQLPSSVKKLPDCPKS